MAEYMNRQEVIDALQAPELFGITPYHIELIKRIPTVDAVPVELFNDLRNELCLHCGKYTLQHLGACYGCKWRADNGK